MADHLTTSAEIDQLEAEMLATGQKVEFPVEHRFVPGVYCRTTTLPKDTLLTSMEHKTEHFFVILKGEVHVSSSTEGSVVYKGPCIGITRPGTRRVIHAVEETVWSTFHVTDETNIDRIAALILSPHSNPLIPEESRNQWKGGACLGSQ